MDSPAAAQDAKKTISLDLILKKNVPSCYKAGEQQPDVVESVLSLKRVWLDNLLITNIDNLEMLGFVTHLYLQDNNIASIENLETIGTTLQHLNIKNNLVTELGDTLICLDRLMSLDISSNRIECIEHKQLPQKITFLNIACNPCIDNGGFDREAVIENLVNLKMIDNEELDSDEESDETEREEEENKLKASSLEKIDEGPEEEMSVMYEKMKADSKSRQTNFDVDHKVRLETLHQIRNNMESHSVRESVELARSSLDDIDMVQHREATTIINRGPTAEIRSPLPTPELKRQNTLPPLDRPLSSKSTKSTKKKSLQKLDKPSSPKPIPGPRGQGLSNIDLSLRPTLDTALVSCNDMEDYVKNVQGMFDGIATDMNKLRD